MIDKFKKETNCHYCGREMDAKNRSKKFCCDKCRVYFGREAKSLIEKGAIDIATTNFKKNETKSVFYVDGNIKPLTEYGKNKVRSMIDKIKEEEVPRLKGETSIEYRLRMIELYENKSK